VLNFHVDWFGGFKYKSHVCAISDRQTDRQTSSSFKALFPLRGAGLNKQTRMCALCGKYVFNVVFRSVAAFPYMGTAEKQADVRRFELLGTSRRRLPCHRRTRPKDRQATVSRQCIDSRQCPSCLHHCPVSNFVWIDNIALNGEAVVYCSRCDFLLPCCCWV